VNVVDSSAWLEYFSNGANAKHFSDVVEDIDELLVPVISVYEVFKRVIQQRGEDLALQAVAQMQQGHVIELNPALALHGARLSLQYKIPMADSLILATARAHDALLWTQDADFKGIDKVKYFSKK
jgi:predicted nucleic acid-binding protein